ncbi:hypothetical protein V8C42DRAFT_304942 [Trichoderma barbatum]
MQCLVWACTMSASHASIMCCVIRGDDREDRISPSTSFNWPGWVPFVRVCLLLEDGGLASPLTTLHYVLFFFCFL